MMKLIKNSFKIKKNNIKHKPFYSIINFEKKGLCILNTCLYKKGKDWTCIKKKYVMKNNMKKICINIMAKTNYMLYFILILIS